MLRRVVTGRSDAEGTPLTQLSNRELEVFRFLGQGFSTRQVAEVLHLSVKTVETYRANVMKKLCLENARTFLHYATQWVSRMGTC